MTSYPGPMTVSSPVPLDVWETALKSDDDAVVAQSLPWRDCVLADGRYRDVSRLYEFDSGTVVVLPLVRPRRVPTLASTVASWPRVWGAAGPISANGQVGADEAAAILADVAGIGALVTELRLRYDASDAWLSAAAGKFAVEESATWDLDLGGGFGQVWERRFRGSFRQAVRKAERSGLDVEVDRSGRLLGEFYDLYQKSIVRWAAMQHAPVWLTRRRLSSDTNPRRLALVADRFGHDCATWVARRHGAAVAAIIVVKSGGYAKYWRGAMDKEGANAVRANELLHRLAIEDACEDGHRWYDLGFARPESPLAAFKQKFGADLHLNRVLRAERLPVQAAAQLPRELVKKAIRFKDNT